MSAYTAEMVTIESVTCYKCGTVFGMSSELKASRKNDGDTFYCPNGHGQHYTVTEAQKLMKQLEEKERELRAAKCEVMNAQAATSAERTEREKAERKLRRVARGVCPCCKRSFLNLKRHMEVKHPESKN